MNGEPTLLFLSPEVLHPSRFQIRLEIDVKGEPFKDLLHSIEREGQKDPVQARPHPDIKGEYEVGSGHSRVLALKMLKRPLVKTLVEDYTDEEMMWLQETENEVHQNLTDYERARWMRKMISEFKYTQATLAERMRRTQSWISQHLGLLNLESHLQPEVLNRLTEFQARMILGAPPNLIPEVCKQINKGWKEYKHLPSAQTIVDTIIPTVHAGTDILSHLASKPPPERLITGQASDLRSALDQVAPIEEEVEPEENEPIKGIEAAPQKPDKAMIETVLKGFKREQLKPDREGGERGWIIHRLENIGLTREEAEEAIKDHMEKIGVAQKPSPVAEKTVLPKRLDVNRMGRGCPVCGRTLAPPIYDELRKRFKDMTLDDFKGMWQ